MNKLSGPLLDRVDIRLQIHTVNATQKLMAREHSSRQTSAQARLRVTQARQLSAERLSGTGYVLNAHVPASVLHKRFAVSKDATKVLDYSLKRGTISMRGYDRCLRLAQTICDLEQANRIDETHIARAVTLRGTARIDRDAA
jgi:magnesium chelatase family protein